MQKNLFSILQRVYLKKKSNKKLMFLNPDVNSLNQAMSFPDSIAISNIRTSKSNIIFPDTKLYYIFSDQNEFQNISCQDETILLNKSFSELIDFHLSDNQVSYMNISNFLFENSKPLDENLQKILDLTIKRTGSKQPSLGNRL